MKGIIKFQLVICTLLVAASIKCSYERKPLEIIPLSPFRKEQGSDSTIQRLKYYLVRNFDDLSPHHADSLKAFAFKNLDSGYEVCNMYSIIFYKETEVTNSKFRENESDLIEWHGDDRIFVVYWRYGKFADVLHFKNGEITNASAPRIEDVKKD